jgi:hypothetical protein
MIDFSSVGTVSIHNVLGKKCLQLHPNESHTLRDMLSVLDAGIAKMNDDSSLVEKARGILLNRRKYVRRGFPIPCVLLFEVKK